MHRIAQSLAGMEWDSFFPLLCSTLFSFARYTTCIRNQIKSNQIRSNQIKLESNHIVSQQHWAKKKIFCEEGRETAQHVRVRSGRLNLASELIEIMLFNLQFRFLHMQMIIFEVKERNIFCNYRREKNRMLQLEPIFLIPLSIPSRSSILLLTTIRFLWFV